MAQAQQEEEDEFDPRLDFIMNYLIKSLRIKPEKWLKMINTDEFKVIIRDFLDEPIHEVLVLSMGGAGLLVPMLGYPPVIKTKACYFIRLRKERVTKDNFRNILIFGDMSPKPVHDLYGMVDDVFIPLLTSQPGWPQVVVEDVREHMYRMKNATYEMIGKMEGKTLLPMPMGVERVHEVQQAIISSGGQDVDLPLKRAIEQMVVKWGTQVKEILNQNSSSVFEKTLHPAPSEEIDFWNARLKNLESIYHQLRDPRVAKMASILELTESVYCKNYKELFINVFEAVLEAREISAFMKALKPQFDVIESTDFNEVRPHLKPLMHVVCLTWGYCRHYCNNTRIILLLREICNMLVQQASKYLDPGSLFQGETEESLARVAQCIESLHIFRQIFEESRQNIASYFPEDVQPQYWNFGGSLVFEYMDKFIERLNAVKDLFATSLEFQKLEKVEVGGIRARWLSPRVESIFAEFEELYSFFSGVPYDPLDPDDASFEKDYTMFRNRIRDFDNRLAAICSQAFDDCVNVEAILKEWSQSL
ncbi:dynein beta chain, ciliary-like [Schistocerca serialis cubense]|uniref:dynein beta chain, ciliary-like n=1 Tax=Schistocerca serialis cubense TaxID=2023355 RepID=UPI00214F2C9A|nr:dynein beta chain, ciliary-like [Schistocerca serialis cubense]